MRTDFAWVITCGNAGYSACARYDISQECEKMAVSSEQEHSSYGWKGWRLWEIVWVSLLALMFGSAGLGLMLKSSEASDVILGAFVLGLSGVGVYLAYRRRRSRIASH